MLDWLKWLFNLSGWQLLLSLLFGFDFSDMDDDDFIDSPDKAITDATRESNIPLNDSRIKKN